MKDEFRDLDYEGIEKALESVQSLGRMRPPERGTRPLITVVTPKGERSDESIIERLHRKFWSSEHVPVELTRSDKVWPDIDYTTIEQRMLALGRIGTTAAQAAKSFGISLESAMPHSEWRDVSKRRARKLKKRGEWVVSDEDGCSWLMVKDLHKLRAAEMFGVGYPNVTNAQRQAAKSAYWLQNYSAGVTHEISPSDLHLNRHAPLERGSSRD